VGGVVLLPEDEALPGEQGDDVRRGAAVLAGRHRGEAAAAGEGEGQQQLIRQIGAGEGGRGEKPRHPVRGLLRERFRGGAELAEAGDDLGRMLEDGFEQQHVAGAERAGELAGLEGRLRPAEMLTRGGEFPLGDVEGKAREQGGGGDREAGAPLDAVDRGERGGADVHLDAAAALREEAVAVEPRLDARAHAVENRQEDPLDEVEGRGGHIVRAALDDEARRPVREDERHQQGLQDETGAAGGPDRETVIAGADPARTEDELPRAEAQPLAFGAADLAGGLDRGQMLAHQSRLLALAADIGDAEGLPGDERERAGVAQHLAAAFAFRSVDGDHGSSIFSSSRGGRTYCRKRSSTAPKRAKLACAWRRLRAWFGPPRTISASCSSCPSSSQKQTLQTS